MYMEKKIYFYFASYLPFSKNGSPLQLWPSLRLPASTRIRSISRFLVVKPQQREGLAPSRRFPLRRFVYINVAIGKQVREGVFV